MFLPGIRLEDLPGVLEFFDERRGGSLERDAAADPPLGAAKDEDATCADRSAVPPAPVPPSEAASVRRRRGR